MTTENPLDLYAVLGVPRTASKRDIHQAFREKARTAHPDVEGGDKALFGQIKLARDILTNDRLRENYDAIGVIEQEGPNNEITSRMLSLRKRYTKVLHSVLTAGKDPRGGDFVAAMLEAVTHDFAEANRYIAQLKQSLEIAEGMRGRFKMINPEYVNVMELVVEGEIKNTQTQLNNWLGELAKLEQDRQDLSFYVFERATVL